ncbi:hypothetical protein E4U17_001286 [Claviceps sp. LM77 group G4]|nr:hypothetical protein E4U17_001286 [Claviceps sp. LM77 group G4]KAG6064660.1 hypothetical protein E4U33_006060 [Claviceps sp. LM78 group G4]
MVEEKVDVEPSVYHNKLIDPRIMMCGSQDPSTTIETQPYFEVSHATPTICNSGYDQEYSQLFTRDPNCSMVWTFPRGIASDMNPMAQISDSLNTECVREEDAVVIDLWDEELRRMEPLDEMSGQPEWQSQFVPFS